MTPEARFISLSLILAFLLAPTAIHSEEEAGREVSLDELRDLREQAEADASLADELKARILELYDGAISSLGAADRYERELARLKREKASIGRLAETLRADLDEPEKIPRLSLPDDATFEQTETALARERALLRAHRNALRDVERRVEERSNARNDASRRLGVLDQELETLADQLRETSQAELHPALSQARRSSLLARRVANRSEIEKLRADLALLESRGSVIPTQVELAQRRVAYHERLVEMIEDAAKRISRKDALEGLERVVQQSRRAAELFPELEDLASETERFARMLWDEDGIILRYEKAAQSVSTTRKNLTELDRIIQLTRRKFEAAGYRGSVTRWWPDVPDDFPEPGDIATDVHQLEKTIPGVQHQLIRFEQHRSDSRDLAKRILVSLGTVEEEVDEEAQQVALELLTVRRDLLDQLIHQYARYNDQLVELETLQRFFLSEIQRVQSFLYERLLWVRSVPRPVIPRAKSLADAFLWLTSGENWSSVADTTGTTAREFPFAFAFSLFVLGLLVGLRRSLRHRMAAIARRISDPASDSFMATLETLVHTLLLAAPLPLVLYMGSQILSQSDVPTFVFAMAEALGHLTYIAVVFEVVRQTMAPSGLGEAHFGLPRHLSRTMHRGLLWPEILTLPAIFVAILFGSAGMRMDSPDSLQAFNNSLGRVIFVLALIGLGSSLVGLFRPRRRNLDAINSGPPSWVERNYLIVYPLVVMGTYVPAILATLGFYITGYLLAYQMLRSVWLLILLAMANHLAIRWRTTSRLGLTDAEEGEDEAEAEEKARAIQEADAQVRRLSQTVLVLVGAVALYGIWSEAVPAFQIMKRAQVLPTIALLEETKDHGLASPVPPGATKQATPAESTAAPESGGVPTPPGTSVPVPADSASSAAASEPASSLTLWHILQFVLAVIVTLMLVRNVPGLLELLLRRRTALDPGARIAVITLVRYVIMIVGFSLAFSHLGLAWSKIQWLAAALTFGLGFGLQEIVANFVSGLILLLERPIRVGDAVTIGNLQGRVSRIHIRATTITLWDRSEMIVPNKEFITTKLVNWTLSDSRRRIDIPLRVTYDANLDTVRSTLLEVARKHPDVLKDPPPGVLLLEFGEDALKFELRYYVDFGEGLRTRDELHMAIDRAFREKGIEFALPQLNIHVPPGERPNLPASS